MAEINLEEYTIKGRSISTVETWIQIPEMDVCFDIGTGPRSISGTENVLLSHFHQDHALGVTKHIATRNLLQIGPPRVFIPYEAEEMFRQLINVWENLENRHLRHRLNPVREGDEIFLRDRLKVRVFSTDHTVPSVGYSLIEERTKLKEKFHDLPGEEIAKMKEERDDMFYTVEIPLVTYTGDTRPTVFEGNEYLQDSKILIAEATFLKPDDREMAARKSHIHLQDIVENRDLLSNKHIVLCHFSARYSRSQVFHYINNNVPEDLRNRIRVMA